MFPWPTVCILCVCVNHVYECLNINNACKHNNGRSAWWTLVFLTACHFYIILFCTIYCFDIWNANKICRRVATGALKGRPPFVGGAPRWKFCCVYTVKFKALKLLKDTAVMSVWLWTVIVNVLFHHSMGSLWFFLKTNQKPRFSKTQLYSPDSYQGCKVGVVM